MKLRLSATYILVADNLYVKKKKMAINKTFIIVLIEMRNQKVILYIKSYNDINSKHFFTTNKGIYNVNDSRNPNTLCLIN